MAELRADLVVVGAGAAGLWAAARAARSAAAAGAALDVVLLEKTRRTGTKVLASGGTHCNLTTTLGERPAAELFGKEGARFLRTAFRALPPSALRARFAELGVPTIEAPLEKVFPESGRARDVRDALEREARDAGVAIVLGAPVRAVEPVPCAGTAGPAGSAGWRLALADGSEVRARGAILCPGGKSYASTGTTGDGYAWLAALDLPVVEPVPALVPLASGAAWVRELAGVALQRAAVRLVDPAQARAELARRERPVLFTHRGVSGPAAMDVSTPVARAEAAARASGGRVALELVVDLVPDVAREALRERLISAASRPGAPLASRALELDLPRRLVQAALVQAGFADEPRANAFDRASRHRAVEALKGLVVPIDGTLGFDEAEVTAGGLALEALDPGTLAVRAYANLWVCGELLDLAGPIGGLNFQAAFATAELAGRDAAGRLA